MQLELKTVKNKDIKTGKSVARSWQEIPCIIVVDKDGTCIFGEGYADTLKKFDFDGETQVLVVSDCDTEELCLTMHTSGKFADYDYQRVVRNPQNKLSQFGYPRISLTDVSKSIEDFVENVNKDKTAGDLF